MAPDPDKRNILDNKSTKRIQFIVGTFLYKSNSMVIPVDSDAAFLTIPKARSCYSGHFYPGDWPSPWPVKPTPKIIGPFRTECKNIRNMVS